MLNKKYSPYFITFALIIVLILIVGFLQVFAYDTDDSLVFCNTKWVYGYDCKYDPYSCPLMDIDDCINSGGTYKCCRDPEICACFIE